MSNLHSRNPRIPSGLKWVCTFVATLVLGLNYGYAQSVVTGTVTDAEGWPLIGVGVVIEGTQTGVITDLDGNYSITVPADATLVYSFIGMATQSEPVNGRSVINVTLQSETTALDAVVVTAMGISKAEKSLSYNVQETKLDNVAPVGSFVNSLNGKVAGVSITSSSSGVGGASRVVMRGTKSVSGNNNALYVIDGIPMQSLSGEQPEGVFAGAGQTGDGLAAVNPEDIETISVLSGPSAAALYGANAANGVVIITTKKGAADKLSVSYSNTTEFSRAYIMPRFQNTYGTSSEGSYFSWGEKLATPSSYNPRDFFRTGLNEVNTISISGGNDKNQTYASVSANNGRGIIHNNDVNKYNFNVRNTTTFAKDKLTLDVAASYARIEEQNMISQGQYMNPVLPVYLFPAGGNWEAVQVYERYDPSRGIKTQYFPYTADFAMQNPYWITENQLYQNKKNRFMGTVQLKYQPFKWLSFSARAKVDRNDETHERKFKAGTNTLFASEYGYYSKGSSATEQKFAEIIASVNKYFLDNTISLTAVVGANIDDITYSSDFTGGNLAFANKFTYGAIIKDNKSELKQEGYHSQQQAIFANVQLGYKSMIYLDLTGRADWSSTLYNVNGIFYPTVGLSGILTEMIPSMKSDIFPYWKIRASYSEVGNSPAASLYLLNPTYPISNSTIQTSTRRVNLDLKPERTRSYEVGTNIHFLKSKLQIDATWYLSNTYNQFFKPQISAGSTNSEIYVNGGQVDNMGVELSARYGDDWGDFHWDTYLTYSTNKNKIVSLLDWYDSTTGQTVKIDKLNMGGFGGVTNILYPGGSMSDVYVTSLQTTDEGFLKTDAQGNVLADYSDAGLLYAGSTDAKHRLSWGNNFAWKGLTFNFLITARLGGIAISKTQQIMDYYGVSQDSADARDKGFVMINGMKNTNVQTYYQTIGADRGVMSQYVYDATNVRLSEISLGYDFPVQKWCNWLKGLNLSFVGHNLLMLYCSAPFDPELTSSTGTYNQGIDYFMQPSLRSFGFSLKVKL